jgi:hypothetical protein
VKKETSLLLPSLQSIVDGICVETDLYNFVSHQGAIPQTDNHRPFSKLNNPNRYKIAGPNNIQSLTVPITQDDKHNPISRVRINYNENWIKDHKHAWQTAYGKSPFFEYYDYRFWSILDAQPMMLSDLLHPWNQLLFVQLGLSAFESTSKETPQNMIQIKPYPQVFDVKFGFRSDVSGIDLLFNQGPLAKEYLSQYLPTNTIFAP